MSNLPTDVTFEDMGWVKLDEPMAPDAAAEITCRLSCCERCGAVVLDEALHVAWHGRSGS